MDIREIKDGLEKEKYADSILRKLPEWFGNEAAIQEYARSAREYAFFAAFAKGVCIGFFSGKIHYGRAGDIYVCGVAPDFQGRGIGRRLYEELERYFVENNCEYVIVKTLSEMNSDKNYAETRKFYRKMGFKELLTLSEMWDENNPCLIMIKNLALSLSRADSAAPASTLPFMSACCLQGVEAKRLLRGG
jgi:ribosomal protein S18 acetylase RimI-like enzyme